MSTFSTDCIVHLSWSTIRHSFRTSYLFERISFVRTLTLKLLPKKLLINLCTINRKISAQKNRKHLYHDVFLRLIFLSLMGTIFPQFLHLIVTLLTEISLNGVRRPHSWHLANWSLPRSFLWIVSSNAVKML